MISRGICSGLYCARPMFIKMSVPPMDSMVLLLVTPALTTPCPWRIFELVIAPPARLLEGAVSWMMPKLDQE